MYNTFCVGAEIFFVFAETGVWSSGICSGGGDPDWRRTGPALSDGANRPKIVAADERGRAKSPGQVDVPYRDGIPALLSSHHETWGKSVTKRVRFPTSGREATIAAPFHKNGSVDYQSRRNLIDVDVPFFKHIMALTGGWNAGIHAIHELAHIAKRYRRKTYYSLNDEEMAQLKDFLVKNSML